MAVATPAAVRKQIQSGQADAIYLLQGEDEVADRYSAPPAAFSREKVLGDWNP